MSHSIAVVAHHDCPVSAPTFVGNDLFTISQTGEIFRYSGNFETEETVIEQWGNSSGQPTGLAFDASGAAYVCDAAHQAIFRIARLEDEPNPPRQEVEPHVREYEREALQGPHSVCIAPDSGMLYFTDAGPLGDTGIGNPRGSVFAIQPSTQLLMPLTLHSLAYPTGLALSPDGNVLYVAEMCKNRVLRYARRPASVYHCSVFHQLSGRLGPTALCCATNGDLYIAHYDFGENTENGRILVVDAEGEVTAIMSVPGPEITGLCISPDERYLLITEATTASVYRHALK